MTAPRKSAASVNQTTEPRVIHSTGCFMIRLERILSSRASNRSPLIAIQPSHWCSNQVQQAMLTKVRAAAVPANTISDGSQAESPTTIGPTTKSSRNA